MCVTNDRHIFLEPILIIDISTTLKYNVNQRKSLYVWHVSQNPVLPYVGKMASAFFFSFNCYFILTYLLNVDLVYMITELCVFA